MEGFLKTGKKEAQKLPPGRLHAEYCSQAEGGGGGRGEVGSNRGALKHGRYLSGFVHELVLYTFESL